MVHEKRRRGARRERKEERREGERGCAQRGGALNGRRDKRAPQARTLTYKPRQKERRKKKGGRGEGRGEDMRAIGALHVRHARRAAMPTSLRNTDIFDMARPMFGWCSGSVFLKCEM
jgi:hypothetical protein